MNARFGRLGEEVGDGGSDGVDEAVDDGRGVDRDGVGRSESGSEDGVGSFDVEADDAACEDAGESGVRATRSRDAPSTARAISTSDSWTSPTPE